MVNLLFSGLVPELVKQLIIVLLSQSRLNDSVQVLLAKDSLHPFTIRSHFNIDELLSGLQRPSELKVEAPTHQDDLDQHDVDHVCPAHRRLEVERFGVVGNHTEIERVAISFLDELFICHFGLFWVELGLSRLEVGIQDQE